MLETFKSLNLPWRRIASEERKSYATSHLSGGVPNECFASAQIEQPTPRRICTLQSPRPQTRKDMNCRVFMRHHLNHLVMSIDHVPTAVALRPYPRPRINGPQVVARAGRRSSFLTLWRDFGDELLEVLLQQTRPQSH